MGLKKLFLITLLAGAMSLLGCGDDETSNGTGATGGTPAGNCDYGDCVDGSTEQDACEAAVGICQSTLPPGSAQDICVEGANVDACGPR